MDVPPARQNMKCDLCCKDRIGMVWIGTPSGTLVVCKECSDEVHVNPVDVKRAEPLQGAKGEAG